MGQQIFGRKWSIWMADTLLNKFPIIQQSWSYDYGVVCKALEMVYKKTGEKKYFDYIKSNFDSFILDNGHDIKYYKESLHNIDYVNNGKILLFLYNETKEEKYANAAALLRHQLSVHPRTSEGGFWHKDVYPHQMWLDGLYMGQPFYAQYTHMFENGSKDEDIVNQFKLIDKHSKDPKTHLLYHGWDESRSMFWADKNTGLSKNFWGRSVGWYSCALVDTLDYITEGRDTLISMVKDLADALINVQNERNGLWYQVMDKQELYGNYPEASCSAMFTYFLFKAVRLGYIDDSFLTYANKAFLGLIREFVEVDQDNLLNYKNTVFVSGLGGDGLRDGSYDYYTSEPKKLNCLLGIGAFIMAASEIDFKDKVINTGVE